MAELPPNFTFIREIRSRPDGVSFAGIVVSTKGIRATKGTHSNLEVVVQDEFDDASDSAITLRYFCWPEDFPDEPEVGDIVFVRHAKASEWNDKMTATSNWELKTDLFIFKSASVPIVQKGYAPSLSGLSSLPHTSNREAVLPKESELKVVLDRRMRSAVRSKQLKQQPSQSTPSKPTRLALIKDLGINVFHDINAQVVKIWSENQSCTDIHVTDYTTNHHLFWHEEPNLEDGMQSRWQGPYGQMTLAVRLYGVNAQWTNDNVSVGDFIFLRNVHLKLSNMNKLEGALHEDRLHPNQNDIRRLLQQSAISEIQKRKADYERQQNAKFIKNEPKKPSAKAAAKKREEKKQMQRLQRELEQKEAEEAEVARSGVNPDVRARDPEIKLSTLAEVQDNSHLNTNTMNGDAMKLPFINTKYRIRGRVVDFYPPKLEDFAHSMIDPTWNPLDVYTRSSWEWGFVLLMEDATASAGQQPSRIRVIVSNDDAEFLLKMKAAE
ncbi:hypothetical protein EJ04DRAFT_177035 [Polyplosphaeria fusca]|uniref:Protection of telomeres protein 1 ssDNA-binding domain-containing protein n=1 Tax=Polyplosphaeria fusca TaxID=682080 RepID=A0A9P4QYP7_9PLEO|nr:hypothetical protein EJ04DRAFT_177035 [Polyplosphaeria fusca]